MGMAIGIFGILNGANVIMMYTVKTMSQGEGIEAEINAREGTFALACSIPVFNLIGLVFLHYFSRRALYIFANSGMSIMLVIASYFVWTNQ